MAQKMTPQTIGLFLYFRSFPKSLQDILRNIYLGNLTNLSYFIGLNLDFIKGIHAKQLDQLSRQVDKSIDKGDIVGAFLILRKHLM